MNRKDYAFIPPEGPQAVRRLPWWTSFALALALMIFMAVFIDAVESRTPEVDPVYEPCTPDEMAYYDARGWDSYECAGDKAWSADANLSFPSLESDE